MFCYTCGSPSHKKDRCPQRIAKIDYNPWMASIYKSIYKLKYK